MFKKIFRSSVIRTDISQFAYYLVGYGGVIVFGYILNVLINKTLSLNELGMFSYVQGVVNILSPLLCFSFYNLYLRFHKEHTLSLSLLRFGIPFYLFSLVGCGIVITFITHSVLPVLYAMIVFFTERQYILRVQMQMWSLNMLRLLELFIPIVGLLVAYIFKVSVSANVLLFLYGIGFSTAFCFNAKSRTNQDPVVKKNLMRYLVPTVATSFLTYFLLNAGAVLAKYYFNLPGAAQWGVAMRAALIFKSFTALFLLFFPMIYFREAEKSNYRLINIYRCAIIVVAILAALPFIIFPKKFYFLFGAADYYSTSILLSLLIGGELCNFISSLFGLFFDFEIKTWKNTIFKCVNSVLFLGCAYLIAEKGITYLAFSYLSSMILCLAGIIIFGFRVEFKYFSLKKQTGVH